MAASAAAGDQQAPAPAHDPEKQNAIGITPQSDTTDPMTEKSDDNTKATQEKKQDDKKEDKKDGKKDKEPAGGYDATPIPKAPPGWTVKFTFVKATNLPIADINSLSSDPYLIAQLDTGLAQRHKEDPALRYRTQTVRRQTEPVWNADWIVANVPSSGFKMKIRVYDEDPADHDDRLGNVHVNVDHISKDWPGIKEQAYHVRKRMGSKRAYLIRAVTTCFRVTHHMHGELYVSVQVLGRTKDENGGRAYTVGPGWWIKHYSPLLGRITGIKEDDDDDKKEERKAAAQSGEGEGSQKKQDKSKAQRYNFQANQMQLPGPVPAGLYHRYVEFKPFVQGMFSNKGLRGFLLNKALHHQHARVYNYDRSTVWGYLPPDDPQAISKRFLELTHYDQGGRIYTYVITLDAQFRFTETGKEFGIDMLSKHTMHSDVSAYIAFSGEFFIRKHRGRQKDRDASAGRKASRSPDPNRPVVGGDAKTDPEEGDTKSENEGGQIDPETPIAHETADKGISTDPSEYELVIDNDSGTYRPNAELLPQLRTYLQRAFPGLNVRVLDCQMDADRMSKLKDAQRERKKKEQGNIVYTQRSRSSSISSVSSSDEEELDRLGGTGGESSRLRDTVKHDAQFRAGARVRHWKEWDPRKQRSGVAGDTGEEKIQQENVEDHAAAAEKEEKEEQKKKEDGEKKAGEGAEKKDDGPSTREKIRKEEEELERKGKAEYQGQEIGTSARNAEEYAEGAATVGKDEPKAHQ